MKDIFTQKLSLTFRRTIVLVFLYHYYYTCDGINVIILGPKRPSLSPFLLPKATRSHIFPSNSWYFCVDKKNNLRISFLMCLNESLYPLESNSHKFTLDLHSTSVFPVHLIDSIHVFGQHYMFHVYDRTMEVCK